MENIKLLLLSILLFAALSAQAQTPNFRVDDFPMFNDLHQDATQENTFGDIFSQVHRYNPDGVDVLYVHDPATYAAIAAMATAGGGPYIVSNNTPTMGDVTITDTGSGESFVIPSNGCNNGFSIDPITSIVTITDGCGSMNLDLSILQYDDTELRDSIAVHRTELDALSDSITVHRTELDNIQIPSWHVYNQTFAGGETSITLTTPTPNINESILISVQGQVLHESQWTRTVNTITFTSYIGIAGREVRVQYMNLD